MVIYAVIDQSQRDGGRLEVETGDIRFRRTLDAADEAVADVRYELRSLAGEPLACRIRDLEVSGLTDEDVYVHPGAENWSVGVDGAVTYTGPLGPGETKAAQVSVHLTDIGGIEDLDTEPAIDIARPKESPAGDQSTDSRSDGGEPPASVPIEIDGSDVGDPPDSPEPPTSTDHGSEPVAEPGSVIDSLVAEIESGDASPAALETLRSALDVPAESADATHNSIRAKVDRLQADIGDLLAYRDALEEFIDAHGTGDELIEELQSGLADVEAELESLGTRVDDLAEHVSETDDRIAGLQAEIESLGAVRHDLEELQADVASTQARHDDKLAALATQVGAVERQLERTSSSLESDLDALAADVEETREWQETLGDALSGRSE